MNTSKSFEERMQELEALVQALEAGQMSLEDSFKSYEKAMAIKAELTALLDEGDRRIRLLTETGEQEIPEESLQ
ncbi:MAG: exodeoxyribonuclease VII small subunit [Clostridia bacterium]|nr:exodeoxyribonuclease VII small subunit [Clostridia bacterium]